MEINSSGSRILYLKLEINCPQKKVSVCNQFGYGGTEGISEFGKHRLEPLEPDLVCTKTWFKQDLSVLTRFRLALAP